MEVFIKSDSIDLKEFSDIEKFDRQGPIGQDSTFGLPFGEAYKERKSVIMQLFSESNLNNFFNIIDS